MTEAELNELAAKLHERLQPPSIPVAGVYQIITHGVIENRLAVLVKAPSQKHYVGYVSDWVEVPNPETKA